MGAGVHWGAAFVARGFLQALLRHAPIARLQVFVAAHGGSRPILEQYQRLIPGAERLEVLPLAALPDRLAADAPVALHSIENHLHTVAYARSLVTGGRFPVTASAFSSPSYHNQLHGHVLDLQANLRPGDTLVCMSDSQRQVFTATYDHLEATVLKGWNGTPSRPALPVVPLGIDPDRIRPTSGQSWRQQWALPADAFVALSLGRLSPMDKQDWEPVLEGFAEAVRAETPGDRPLVLVIAGNDQGYARRLQQWGEDWGISGRLRIVSEVPEQDKSALLSAADCFLALPDNPQEAFGYSVLEAMACGLPIVAADWDGLKETVTPDVGIRVPTWWGDATGSLDRLTPLYRATEGTLVHLALAQSVAVDVAAAWAAVRSLAADPPQCRRLGAAARARAVQVYAWPVIVAQYMAVWQEAAEQAARAPVLPAGVHVTSAYDRTFAHYPSRRLDAGTLVARTERWPPGMIPASPYANANDHLDPAILHWLDGALSGPATVGALLERSAFADDRMIYHLLWLLKRGRLAAQHR
jgi:glycosyltransferase involved in cell wall biosynthesis